MTRRFNILLLVLLLVFGLPYYWLLIDSRPGEARAKPVSIGQLRQLAASIPGQRPTAVEVEQVAFDRMPGNVFVAGSGIKRKLFGFMAFRLPVPGSGAVIIDSGMTANSAKELGVEAFIVPAQARVNAAMQRAGLILMTHEHVDHMAGLAAIANTPAMTRARLNPQQLPGAPLAATLPWARREGLKATLAGGAPQAVAPGIVVIPAPSHTPGSQMIFVQLASGAEYLFTGDIATMAQSWLELRARSRLMSDYLAPEDRSEVFAWQLTIRKLATDAPGLTVIPGHDHLMLMNNRTKFGIIDHFTPDSVPGRSGY